MPKTRELTPFERGEIVGLSKGGHSIRKISEILNIPKSTVHDVITKYNEENCTDTIPRSGRPPILSERDKRQLGRIVRQNRKQAVEEITEQFNQNLNISVCSKTIIRTLHSMGYYGRTGRKKPLVSEVNRKKRLFWCYARKSWQDEWNFIIFSDESRFELFRNDANQWVWRRVYEAYAKDCLIPTVQKSKGVMVWGCFCNFKVGPLVLVEGRLNAKKYIELLEHYLLPFINELRLNSYTFQDDNAPAHSARLTESWKEKNLHQTLPWPAQSPDLNPIENLWDVLERKVRMRNPKPKNKSELFVALEEEWYQLESERLLKLIESMPRRIKAVVKSKGYPMPY